MRISAVSRGFGLLNVLVNPAPRTLQTAEVVFLNPLGQGGWLVPQFLFSGFRAAVFAEPAITQIEEMGCLVHEF